MKRRTNFELQMALQNFYNEWLRVVDGKKINYKPSKAMIKEMKVCYRQLVDLIFWHK